MTSRCSIVVYFKAEQRRVPKKVGDDGGASERMLCVTPGGRANRAQEAPLWVHGACGFRLPWRVWRSGMTQGTWGAQGMLMGTTLPSCTSRGDRALYAAFARFARIRSKKNALSRMMP